VPSSSAQLRRYSHAFGGPLPYCPLPLGALLWREPKPNQKNLRPAYDNKGVCSNVYLILLWLRQNCSPSLPSEASLGVLSPSYGTIYSDGGLDHSELPVDLPILVDAPQSLPLSGLEASDHVRLHVWIKCGVVCGSYPSLASRPAIRIMGMRKRQEYDMNGNMYGMQPLPDSVVTVCTSERQLHCEWAYEGTLPLHLPPHTV
jgi:hypothetical protein